ncbi:hypothetical protein SLA2020_524280 [Shorea laevis]
MNPDSVQPNNNSNNKKSVLRSIETGILNKIPPELFTHVLKFLSSEREEDLIEPVRNCLPEFKEYYIQMQEAKQSQAPLPSQVKDDRIFLDKTVADQISRWKSRHGLAYKVFTDHACSGETCSYHQIGNVFVCGKIGYVHVCDDTCREVILEPTNELLVCTISGHCLDRLLSPSEMELDPELPLPPCPFQFLVFIHS